MPIVKHFYKATMSMPILWIFILTNAILVYGAPKLGHVLFDPLSYEANKYDKLKAFLRDVIAQNETIKPSTKFCGSCIEDNTEKIKLKPTTSEVPQNIARNNEAPVKTPNKVSELLKIFENAMEKVKVKNPLRQGSDDVSKNREPGAEYDFNGANCKIVNNRLLCGYDKNKGELKTDEFIDVGNGCRLIKERVECGYDSPPFTGNVRRPPARDTHNLRSRQQDDLKNIARTVLRAISEQESKMDISTNDSKTGSPSITESVSPKSTEDITNSTPATVPDINSTITDVTVSNTLTTTTEFLVTSTTEGATESPANLTTEITQNITSSSTISPKLVTLPILEYLLKYFLPLRMLDESSSSTTLAPSTPKMLDESTSSTTLAPSTPKVLDESSSSTTLAPSTPKVTSDITSAPSTLKVTSDLLVSETAVESSTSESEEFLTNYIEVDVAENSSVSTSSISEVTGNSSDQQTIASLSSIRSPKIVRRSADVGSEETTLRSESARNGNKPSRWCVEKGDRIVCYYADNSFVLD